MFLEVFSNGTFFDVILQCQFRPLSDLNELVWDIQKSLDSIE